LKKAAVMFMVWGGKNKTPSAYSRDSSFSFILKIILNCAPAALLKEIAPGNRLLLSLTCA
jgi:hypothetical protein